MRIGLRQPHIESFSNSRQIEVSRGVEPSVEEGVEPSVEEGVEENNVDRYSCQGGVEE